MGYDSLFPARVPPTVGDPRQNDAQLQHFSHQRPADASHAALYLPNEPVDSENEDRTFTPEGNEVQVAAAPPTTCRYTRALHSGRRATNFATRKGIASHASDHVHTDAARGLVAEIVMLITEGWIDLEQELMACAQRQRPLRYVPNHGNAGDSLIAAGAWQLFDFLRLKPLVTQTADLCSGDVVVYAGGGNLVPQYHDCERFLERCLLVGVERAVVLPHTIRGHQGLLSRLDNRFVLACRDGESLRHVRASGTRARTILAPDLALRLQVDTLFRRCDTLPARRTLGCDLIAGNQWKSYARWRLALAALKRVYRETVFALRTDTEAVSLLPGSRIWDVSRLYASPFLYRSESDFVARDMLALMRRAQTVITNRLHVGIAAALVGRRVVYLDNSYGKIGAVYETWLKDVSNISFAPILGPTELLLW